MAVSILDTIREEARQALTGDSRYKEKGAHVFVLTGPPGEGPLDPLLGVAQFPLPVNPDTFEYRLPFASEITALQEGGIVSEEHGIVIGELRLSGITGFKLRANLGELSTGRGDGEFTGGVDGGQSLMTVGGEGVSGQMHFWRLASRCFDGYSALKKDPKSSQLTKMEYHNIKEDLHVQVIPREFTLERNAAKERVTYRYNIRLAVVGPAATEIFIPSPDIGLLQSFKNTISKIRSAVQGIAAAVDDITAAIDEIRRSITSVASILDDVASILDAGTGLVNGTRKFADIPKAFINATGNLVTSAANLAATVASFPADVAQSFREIEDNANRMATAARNHFRETFAEVTRKYERLSEGHREGKDPVRDAAASALASEAAGGQGRLSVERAFGGSVKPGDAKRGRIDQIASRSRLKPGSYQGFEERVVGQGDTIQSLAAKHMGDARLWPALALANQLKAPYISDNALPGTLQVGKRIIVPLREAARDPDTLTTGNPELGESQADRLLGRDFELVQQEDGTFGWAIDKASAGSDVRSVSGVPNIEQAVGSRFRTEQGHNILYPNIGLPRVIGTNGRRNELVNIRYEARRQLLADSRIKRVASFAFVSENDVVKLEASVVPVGFTSERVISRTLT